MSLSYTTGNPNNLTGGANASMNDVQGPFVDIKTFLTDGSAAVGDTILASPSNPVWRTVVELDYRGGISSLSTTASYVGGTALLPSGGGGGQAISGLWLVPTASDVAVAGKTTRLRVRVSYATNATGPGITLTWGLYPVTGLAGGVGAIVATLGTVAAGSTAAAASPVANTSGEVKSGSFDLSGLIAGGGYVIGVVGSGAQAGNSLLACTAYLEMRHT